MTDIVDKATRSRMMAGIQGKGHKIPDAAKKSYSFPSLQVQAA